jgi:hypothetical protein
LISRLISRISSIPFRCPRSTAFDTRHSTAIKKRMTKRIRAVRTVIGTSAGRGSPVLEKRFVF